MNHLLLCNNKEKEGKKYVLHEWIRVSEAYLQDISQVILQLFEFVKHAKNYGAHTQLYMCSSKKDIKISFKGLSVFCDLKNARSSLRFGRRGLEMLFEICV